MDTLAGFDMVPRLSEDDDAGLYLWNRFIDIVLTKYLDDKQVELDFDRLTFKAGEHPSLPLNGLRFLRFSSKITGPTAEGTGIGNYIRDVGKIACALFGRRIHVWNQLSEEYGYYDWETVRAAEQESDRLDEPRMRGVMPEGLQSIEEHAGDTTSPMYEIQQLARKGRGLVATRFISKGTRILTEKPLILVRNDYPESMEKDIAQKLRSLSKEQQRQYLSLHNSFPGKTPFSGIARTNALPCGSEALDGGVYPTASLINHSCRPNAHNNWNDASKHETIHAIRDIKPGEEITISYCEGSQQIRDTKLYKSFGFVCSCNLCRLPSAECEQSDARREKISALDDGIADQFRIMFDPRGCLADCRALLETIEAEFGDASGTLHARLYYDAFQISIAHGDKARAAVFATRAYESRIICEGEDSPETQRMKGFSIHPDSHPSFGKCSMQWNSEVSGPQKDLRREEFEKWLWGQS